MLLPAECVAKVCGDGRKHPGFFCGKGKCNAFGCYCDNGCIEGDAVENFRQITGLWDAKSRVYAGDPTTWI